MAENEKTLKSRITVRRGTARQWAQASSRGFVPKAGEPIFYQEDSLYPEEIANILKIGNGYDTPDKLSSLTIDDGDISEQTTF